MRRRKPDPEPPCDPSQVVVGDTVTATRWPRKWRYNHLMQVSGTVRARCETSLTLITAGGYVTIRPQDVQKIKKVTA